MKEVGSMSKSHISLIIVSLLILLNTIAPSNGLAGPATLRVLHMPYLSFAPFFIAYEEGYFSAQGLTIEFIPMRRSSMAIPALVKGELDVVAGTSNYSLFNAIARGARIKIVAGKGYIAPTGCATTAILVRTAMGLTPETLTAERLRGLRIALNLSSSRTYLIDRFLNQYGLSLSDIVVVDIPSTILANAFETGAIDLTYATEPRLSRIIREGNAKVLEPMKRFAPDYQLGFVAFGPNLVDEHPDLGLKFIKAYLRAVKQYSHGPTPRNVDIVAKHTKLGPDILQAACGPTFRPGGSINVDTILEFQQWGYKKNRLDRVLSSDEFWDPRFIQQSTHP